MDVLNHTVYYFEIITNDVEGTTRSYTHLYGWRFAPMGPDWGHALVAELPNGGRCGIRAPMHELEKPVVRTYISVADIEHSAKAADESGAEVLLPPTEIPGGHGTIAIYQVGGIEQGIWQLP